MEKRRVVINGMGVVTPIGNSIKGFWQGVLAGKSGADLITKFDTSQHTSKFACELKNFSYENILEPRKPTALIPSVSMRLLQRTKQSMIRGSISRKRIRNELGCW